MGTLAVIIALSLCASLAFGATPSPVPASERAEMLFPPTFPEPKAPEKPGAANPWLEASPVRRVCDLWVVVVGIFPIVLVHCPGLSRFNQSASYAVECHPHKCTKARGPRRRFGSPALRYFLPRLPPRFLPLALPAFSGFSALALAADGMPLGYSIPIVALASATSTCAQKRW